MNTAPYVRGSDTSKAAAQRVRWTDEQRVLACIADRGAYGATDDEVERFLCMRHQTASARRRGLVLAGKVTDSGKRRATRSGRTATVWIVVAAAWKQGDLPGVVS